MYNHKIERPLVIEYHNEGPLTFFKEVLDVKIYQASLFLGVLKRYHELFPKEPLNVLISLAYNESERKGFVIDHRDMIDSIVADSGAWSVAQGKSNLTLAEVISHLVTWGSSYGHYFNFDNNFSTNGFNHNIANQIMMERAGLTPIPVVHNFYNHEIGWYVRSGKYDWLALGSSQSKNFKDIEYAVDKIKKWGNPDIKIHWFGGSKFEWLCELPIASCDTTSWAATGMYGSIMYWNPNNPGLNKADKIYVGGRIKELKESEHHFVTYPWRKELEAYLADSFGLTYADLCGYQDKFCMQLVNTRFFVEQERRINDERIRRGIALE